MHPTTFENDCMFLNLTGTNGPCNGAVTMTVGCVLVLTAIMIDGNILFLRCAVIESYLRKVCY